MKTRLLLLPVAGAALALLPVLSNAEDEIKSPPKVDLRIAPSKSRVEAPLKTALEKAAPPRALKPKLTELPTKTKPALWTGVGKSAVEGPVLRRLNRKGKLVVAPPNGPIVDPPLATNNKKREVERPVRQALRGSPYSPSTPNNGLLKGGSLVPAKSVLGRGVSKGMVEWPLKRALKRPGPVAVKRKTPQPGKGDRVQPGLVIWHKSYEAALAAAKKSGKPVLLLHTLGRLDDRFC